MIFSYKSCNLDYLSDYMADSSNQKCFNQQILHHVTSILVSIVHGAILGGVVQALCTDMTRCFPVILQEAGRIKNRV